MSSYKWFVAAFLLIGLVAVILMMVGCDKLGWSGMIMSGKEVYITVAPKSAHDSTPEYTVWTREAAINVAKTAAQLNGYTYKDDEKALADFIVGHWAWPATLVDV